MRPVSKTCPERLSQKSGVPVEELSRKLAEVLPQDVDTMTPNGAIPKAKGDQ